MQWVCMRSNNRSSGPYSAQTPSQHVNMLRHSIDIQLAGVIVEAHREVV